MARFPLRKIQRVCIPGVVISRAVGAVLGTLGMAGPEIVKWLEPHAERLVYSPSPVPSRLERLQRAVVLWLLEAPDTEPEPTEEPVQRSPALQAAALALSGLRRGTPEQPCQALQTSQAGLAIDHRKARKEQMHLQDKRAAMIAFKPITFGSFGSFLKWLEHD